MKRKKELRVENHLVRANEKRVTFAISPNYCLQKKKNKNNEALSSFSISYKNDEWNCMALKIELRRNWLEAKIGISI